MAKIEELSSDDSGTEVSEGNKTATKDGKGDIDFTAKTPDDYMPEGIDDVVNNLRRRKRQTDDGSNEGEDGSDDDVSEGGENPDFFDDTGSGSSDENSGKKKFIAILLIGPMVISAFAMMSDAFKKFNLDNTAMQITAAVGGASFALYAMAKIPQLRDALKFVMCFAWVIVLLPTYQVYTCSPIELKNSMLGTWFKLKTDPSRFLESSYVTSECFRAFYLQAPYSLSTLSPKIRLVVQIDDLINLDASSEKKGSETPQTSPNYFLAVSKRSVKKKFHKLYLLFEAQSSEADTMMKSLKLPAAEKDKILLVITGTVVHIEDDLLPMKKELEKLNYHVRPIKFKVVSVTYRDKYVKLKPTADESMY